MPSGEFCQHRGACRRGLSPNAQWKVGSSQQMGTAFWPTAYWLLPTATTAACWRASLFAAPFLNAYAACRLCSQIIQIGESLPIVPIKGDVTPRCCWRSVLPLRSERRRAAVFLTLLSPHMLRYLVLCACLLSSSGCMFLPTISRQPTYHNPFPQSCRKWRSPPSLNFSTEPTLDGRQVALAYFNELQSVPGFEVVPIGRVEEAMRAYGLTLANPDEARKLAQLLEVDAVVVGAVTDFTPYYPPRLALQVEWYSANPNFHPIPPGYGLPWGTPDEEQIPGPLIFEARMALAREQMKTQEPAYRPAKACSRTATRRPRPITAAAGQEERTPAGENQPVAATGVGTDSPVDMTAPGGTPATPPSATPGLPPDWPDPRGFTHNLPPLQPAFPAGGSFEGARAAAHQDVQRQRCRCDRGPGHLRLFSRRRSL